MRKTGKSSEVASSLQSAERLCLVISETLVTWDNVLNV